MKTMTSSTKLRPSSITEAVDRSLLAEFPPALRQALLQEALRTELPAGTILYYEEDEPRCGLVVAGLIRVFMTSPDARQITVRYARPGDLLGIAAIVGGPAPTSVQIITDSALLMFNVKALQKSAQEEPKVGWLMAQEVTRRLYDALERLAGESFGSLRQHVARHLLDLAASRQKGPGLLANVTQQELADAVGSVRPVVARIIREFRTAGIVSTSSDGIVVLKPAELHAIIWSREL